MEERRLDESLVVRRHGPRVTSAALTVLDLVDAEGGAIDDGLRAGVTLAIKLAIEVDGWEFHSSRAAFPRDRRRDRVLARLGWHVVRFTAADVLDHPDQFVDEVRALVEARGLLFG